MKFLARTIVGGVVLAIMAVAFYFAGGYVAPFIGLAPIAGASGIVAQTALGFMTAFVISGVVAIAHTLGGLLLER